MIQNSQSKTQRIQVLDSQTKSKNVSTGVKSTHKLEPIKKKTRREKLQDTSKVFKKTGIPYVKQFEVHTQQRKERKTTKSRVVLLHYQTAYNSKRKESIDRLVSSSLKHFSTEKRIKEKELRQLTQSRSKHREQMRDFQRSTRLDNLKKFAPLQRSTRERLPWGVDQVRIKKHVISTIQKLNKIKNPSRSNSKSPKKRDRKKLGLGFLDKLSPEKVQNLISKSQRSSKDLGSSRPFQSQNNQIKTQQSHSRFPQHKLDIMQKFDFEQTGRLFPSLSMLNIGSIKRVVPR